jgi:hypothetical protein
MFQSGSNLLGSKCHLLLPLLRCRETCSLMATSNAF